ncbi:chemotaxis response regulator protein-glutamate methylesterase [Granulosicoccus sp.]|nr:chemotaxis response regulator protein-glutamate methylesterase [Granulosicoccus sp.]
MATEITTGKKIKVLIVDDSITICRFLEATFSEDPDFEVVGYALDAFEAREKIKALEPDVLTLDVEMPKMDGVTFLKNLMRLNPMPVVMFSSLTDIGAAATLDALEAGAVDFMPKHSARTGEHVDEYIGQLVRKVKVAAGARMVKSGVASAPTTLPDLTPLLQKLRRGSRTNSSLKRIIAIGASTGGPEALRQIIGQLSVLDCAFVVGQHMPSNFMASFTQRMNSQSEFDVAIANDGEMVLAGRGYVAPGDRHLTLEKRNDGFYWKILDSAKVSGHRPSVDVLFKSVATHAPAKAIGVLLTGMGVDGAQGLKDMRDSGSATIIQDKLSSVVWGMPGKADAISAQDMTLELDQIAPAINKLITQLS